MTRLLPPPTTTAAAAAGSTPQAAAHGLFLSFEGGEGSGKSTQLARVAARLRDLHGAGRVLTLREPGGTPIGEEIRVLLKSPARGQNMDPATELLLFAANRAQLVREVIRPALAASSIVLCDRFADSTTVYQGVARRLDSAVVAAVNGFAVGERWPDATVLLDLPAERARARVHGRAGSAPVLLEDRFDAESDRFFEAVREGYRRLAETAPDRFLVLDADRPAEAIAAELWQRLNARFPEVFMVSGEW